MQKQDQETFKQAMNLWELKPLKKGLILFLSQKSEDLERYGLQPGSSIQCLYQMPFKGPKVFQVDDTLLTLSKNLAQAIEIQAYE